MIVTPTREPTFRCPICRDRGIVSVIDPRYWRIGIATDCGVPCRCEAGDRWARPSGKRTEWRARFYAPTMFPVMDGITETVLTAFREWLSDPDRLLSAADSEIRSQSSYEPAFDRYNAEAEQQEFSF